MIWNACRHCESSPGRVTRDKRRFLRHGTSKGNRALDPRHREQKPCSSTKTRPEMTSEVFCSLSKTISPSRGPLEQVADGDFRKQLELTVPLYRSGEWMYEFKTSSPTSTILNSFFAETEQKGKTRHFRAYIGPGSDGSSADKLSLDLKFNPWDTAISFQLE